MALDISRIKAICFDIDGTLRDTDDYYVDQIAKFIQPFRFLFTDQDQLPIARKLVMRMEGPVNRIFALADNVGLDPLLHRLVEIIDPRNKRKGKDSNAMVANTYHVIEQLAKRYPLAIVTTRSEDNVTHFLRQNKLLSFFGPIASALTTERGKPKPDPILWAAKEMNIEAGYCLMVGDTVMDIQAGKAAGAQTLAVLSGFGEQEELEVSGATLILHSVAEMASIFQD